MLSPASKLFPCPKQGDALIIRHVNALQPLHLRPVFGLHLFGLFFQPPWRRPGRFLAARGGRFIVILLRYLKERISPRRRRRCWRFLIELQGGLSGENLFPGVGNMVRDNLVCDHMRVFYIIYIPSTFR